jgi:hypothetical protein
MRLLHGCANPKSAKMADRSQESTELHRDSPDPADISQLAAATIHKKMFCARDSRMAT